MTWTDRQTQDRQTDRQKIMQVFVFNNKDRQTDKIYKLLYVYARIDFYFFRVCLSCLSEPRHCWDGGVDRQFLSDRQNKLSVRNVAAVEFDGPTMRWWSDEVREEV